MKLAMPIYSENKQRELVTEFHGYNCTDTGGDGGGKSTFSDMFNGGTGKFPFAASRLPRSVTQYDEATCALYGGEVLARVQPPCLIYGDRQIDLALTAGEKQMVRFGTKLLVFPDGKYFDTTNGESGDMDVGEKINEEVTLEGVTVEGIAESGGVQLDVNWTDIDTGSVITTRAFYIYNYKTCSELPTEAGEGFYRYNNELYYPYKGNCTDRASSNHYTIYVSEWKKYNITKVAVLTELFDNASNIWANNNYINHEKHESNNDAWYVLIPDGRVFDYFEDFYLDSFSHLCSKISWRYRTLPFFDYVTVCDNRLFGCRYGIPYDGTAPVNRIYISALNNFKAFEQFNAISTDSWWGDVSEEGAFTAACTFNGYPMFFKEDYMYVLYGDYPPYSYEPVKLRGVAAGAAKSLVEINGALFYKSRYDIMRYTNSSLSSISQALGNLPENVTARGGAYRDCYYISLGDEIYVYDTARGIWSKEDSMPVTDFAACKGELHFLTDDGAVYKVNGGEESMEWSLTSPPIGYNYPNRKKLSSLRIRIEVGEEDELPKVELSFDGGEFIEKRVRVNFLSSEGKRSGSVLVPILPRRCETFRYRISGKGTYKLTGVTKILKESGN